ncbi:PEP-CTERM sorting domain-containing protein [uncultured Aquabacterium sp.]|uniref:PEP-CTERM sorting domain-containing protein n=1 Tax=uncultured Aquabacterium sp. TaxID=158753 RepID=UPI0026252E14|nr:PEP-CTERM sorting domain-containing protein [uncultured Aquabacterium sp.]
MSQFPRLALAGTLALATAGVAHATSSVMSTISNIAVTTAGTVTAYSPFAQAVVSAYDLVPHPLVGWLSTNAVSDWASDLSTPSPSVSVNVASDSATASAFASATNVSAAVTTGAAGGSGYATASFNSVFSMAARSRVTVTWDASVLGMGAGNGTFLTYTGYGTVTGAAHVDLGNISASTQGNGFWYGDDDFGFSFEETATGKKLTVSTGATGRDISFAASVFAQTVDYAAPVPEPETWALTFAGLAVMGGIARRRIAK